MRIFIILIFFTISAFHYSFACSCDTQSFCTTAEHKPDDLVTKVAVLGFSDHAIVLLNIDVIRGVELRDTLYVYDGTDFDCNGIFSMAANQIGNIGDTMLIILPKIDSIENALDVIGDYRMPDWFCYTYKLEISENFIKGYINGYYPYYYLGEYPYDDFKESWLANGNSCAEIPTTSISTYNKNEFIKIYPNPASHFIYLKGNLDFSNCELTIVDNYGKIIFRENNFDINKPINTSDLSSGLYQIVIYKNDAFLYREKFVKN